MTIVRGPIASPPVPALVVRSASSSDSSDHTGPGPVTSDRVCTIRTMSLSGDRSTVERYFGYRNGGWSS